MATTRDIRWTLLANLVEDAAGAGTPLSTVGQLEELARAVQELQAEEVREAVTAGCSWAEVAAAVGISKQGAWTRWAPQARFVGPQRGPLDRPRE